MKAITNIMTAIAVTVVFTSCDAKIKNPKTADVKVYGNCGMCEKTIEKAGNLKNIASVDWDKDTKMATLTFDATQTNQDEILQRIALAGYDSDAFAASEGSYSKLAKCCQYDRKAEKLTMASETNDATTTVSDEKASPLQTVFNDYFAIKEALVKTDAATSSAKAKALVTAIKAVKMESLENDVHMVWMKVYKNLEKDAAAIASAKDIEKQRASFATLSTNMYTLQKASKSDTPTYYQYCPMANNGKGANWLSKEKAMKNPYYGSKMLSCGSVSETLN